MLKIQAPSGVLAGVVLDCDFPSSRIIGHTPSILNLSFSWRHLYSLDVFTANPLDLHASLVFSSL